MQNLSKFAATAFVVLALTGAAFMKKTSTLSAGSSAVALAKAEALAKAAPVAKPATPAKDAYVNVYWWYSAFDGSYNDYQTLSQEIYEMEIYYDCTVNTTPGGGTLIEKGFWPNNNPNYPPMYFLYAHFR